MIKLKILGVFNLVFGVFMVLYEIVGFAGTLAFLHDESAYIDLPKFAMGLINLAVGYRLVKMNRPRWQALLLGVISLGVVGWLLRLDIMLEGSFVASPLLFNLYLGIFIASLFLVVILISWLSWDKPLKSFIGRTIQSVRRSAFGGWKLILLGIGAIWIVFKLIDFLWLATVVLVHYLGM